MLLHQAARDEDTLGLLVLGMKCELLYARMRRRVYIQLCVQYCMAKRGDNMGMLVKAMYGTRDAPQMSPDEVWREMSRLGYRASVMHPSVYWRADDKAFVVLQVEGMLCVCPWGKLDEIYVELKKVHDLKNTMSRGGTGRQVLEPGCL